MAKPYQPSLLRLLHGANALLLPLTWVTGLAVYSVHDGRWGRLPFPRDLAWIDIHGTFGVILWPLALLFTLYALTLGRSRLQQPANAVALAALVLAVGSGKLMQEEWLKRGQLDHSVYAVHLLAWLGISAAVLWHGLAVVRRGGWPLARSMASLRIRSGDAPTDWPQQLLRPWFSRR